MKRIVLLCIVIALLLSLAACGINNTLPEKPDEPMQTVVDCIGREISLPQNVDKIAATFSPAGHITVMLGHGNDIVATSNGLQRDKLLHEICPRIKEASVVKVSGDFNIEELVALEVDVVFISYDMYLDEKATSKLEEFGLPYVVVYFNSIEDQKQLVGVIADVLNEDVEAEAYYTLYNDVIDEVSAALAGLSEDDKIRVYHSINEAVNTVADGTLPADWMKVAGGIDVSLNSDLMQEDDKYYTTLEQILVWNAEVILCNVEGTDEYIRTQPAWENIEAVKNHRVYLMPVGLSRWGHTTSTETPLAIVWTAKTLYPEYCADIDMEAWMRRFYSELFEYDVSDDQIAAILAGNGMRLSKKLE